MYRGLIKRDVVLGNALVDMYAKCNALPEAQNVLEGLPIRNVVSWSALIVGYAQQDRGQEALDAFEKMQKEGFYPDAVTFVGILKACGNTWAIGKGEHIHEVIMSRKLLEKDTALGNALVDMYAKFGMLTKAKQVLEQLSLRDIVSWNALIAGYAQQGDGCAALACFHEMQSHGLTPDDVTFLSVLSACTHSGLLREAQMVFQDMTKKHGAIPTLEHHTCMVSVFGCVGNFDRALSMIKVMPSSDDIAVWLALLGACKKWGNVELGRLVFNQALQLDDTCSAAYALMASVFASAGLHEDAEKVEAMKLKYASGKEQGDFVRVDCTPKAKIYGL
jgi:pentatricopeptide repeat protein